MEFFNKLGQVQKLIVVFAALFVACIVFGVVMAHANNQPIEWEQQLAEGFYYAAIGFALYHLVTRNKQIREQKETVARDASTTAGDDETSADGDKPQA